MEQIQAQYLNIFERFVVLNEKKIGKIEGIYAKNGEELRKEC